DLPCAEVAVRVVTAVPIAGQPGHPVGGEQPQRVPPLRAPRVRHLCAFEDDVVDRTGGEAVADGQPAVAGTDDHGGRTRHGCASPCSLGLDQFALTVTLVGLVMMS